MRTSLKAYGKEVPEYVIFHRPVSVEICFFLFNLLCLELDLDRSISCVMYPFGQLHCRLLTRSAIHMSNAPYLSVN